MCFHIFLQARLGSNRFPKKILENIDGNNTILDVIAERLSNSKGKLHLLTTVNKEDNVLEKWAYNKNIKCYRGSENNVLDRYYKAAIEFESDIICRITSDCPLIDFKLIDDYYSIFNKSDFEYLSNSISQKMPDGMDIEFFRVNSLRDIWRRPNLRLRHKEHVTPFFYENPKLYKIKSILTDFDHSCISLTVDYKSDLIRLKNLIAFLGGHQKIDYNKIIEIYKQDNSIVRSCLFRDEERNISYKQQLEKDI
tara:strand:- start:2133 stop:2888 length:756 start_codon:yes stop_codon:yes gene_type:complete